ncbi:MAG: hypothetical protein GKR93_18800 [Gammaproteobacteria bacterium]|nr:hypothetical protein [Gammaproteobacteria bacterium]
MNHINSQSHPLFFTAIKLNAGFSIICAGFMLIFSKDISCLLGADVKTELLIIGGFLLLFGGWLSYLIQTDKVKRTDAWMIVAGDVAWVVYTEILVLFYATFFSFPGLLLIGMTSLVVGIFTILQSVSLFRESKTGGPAIN